MCFYILFDSFSTSLLKFPSNLQVEVKFDTLEGVRETHKHTLTVVSKFTVRAVPVIWYPWLTNVGVLF